MNQMPRMAIGTIQPHADSQAMLWALNECLNQQGLNVQNFSAHPSSTACCAERDHCQNPVRALDSWLLSERSCQELFWHSTRFADIAVVSGSYDPIQHAAGPSLDTLCEQLDLARIVVLDASQMGSCLIPPRPDCVDAILIDRLPVNDSLQHWQIMFESLWNTPVLGSLNLLSDTSETSRDLARRVTISTDQRQRLGRLLSRNLDIRRLLQITRRNQLSAPAHQLFAKRPATSQVRIAVALDEAFPCHCPDTLDLFESFGASLHEFSPLRSENLPPETDLVYISCGHLETMAEKLAENICLQQALQSYASRGGHVYAECDGLAYLCKEIRRPSGEVIPMVGLLPATAQLQPQVVQAIPQETHLLHDSWFGKRGTRLRAYWNPRWQLTASQSIAPIALTASATPMVIRHQQVIGNLAHLDFLAHPEYLPQVLTPANEYLSTFH